MATEWIECVYDRAAGATMTYDDLNRICNNVNLLCDTEYSEAWTTKDILDLSTWTSLLNDITEAAADLRCSIKTPLSTVQTFEEINHIEQVLEELYIYKKLKEANKEYSIYSGQDYYLQTEYYEYLR